MMHDKKPQIPLSKSKKRVFWILLMLLAAGLAFSTSEITLRIFSTWEVAADSPLQVSQVPGLFYELSRNYSSDNVQIDAFGFRLRTDAPPVRNPLQTVLILGDSIAFANGVAYEESFTPLLEDSLTAALGPVAIWNSATPGYNTEQEAIQFELAGPRLNPDLTIVEFCMNDYLEPPRLTASGLLDATGSGSGTGISPIAWLRSSRTFIFSKEQVKDLQEARPEWFPRWAHYIHYVHKKPGWQRAKAALERMQNTANSLGSRLLVVVFPMEQQLRSSERDAIDDLTTFASEKGIAVLDLYPEFQRHWREGLYADYWAETGSVDKLHLNERGHQIAADEMARVVLEGMLLQP